jgi:GT2 family glycosyltransferase
VTGAKDESAALAPLDATVLVCSRDRPAFLLDAVQSVLAGERVPAELLVVDQSSVGNARIEGIGNVLGCNVRYLHSATRGLSRARNVGLRSASNEIVVMIDDDMLVEPHWLERLLEGIEAAGPRGLASGRVLAATTDGEGRVPDAALVTRAEPAIYRGRQPNDVMPGANVAVPRSLVLELGGYDERLGAGTRFSAADDNDMGFRLLEAGCELRHVPEAVAFHRPWRSGGERLRLRWRYGRGKGAFYAKHLRLSDRFMWRRLAADIGSRARRAGAAVPRRPRTVVGEAVSVGGILSGALSWAIREVVLGRDQAGSTSDS